MRSYFAALAFLMLAGCGGGGGAAGPCVLVAEVNGTGGTVSFPGGSTPTTGEFSKGTTVTLTAHPDPGFAVATWSATDDDTSTATTNTVTLHAASTIVEVTFAPLPPISSG